MTLVLALESSTLVSRVAVLEDEHLLGERAEPASQHSEALLPLTDAILRELGKAAPAVDSIVTSAGPGSFTGLRIGLATAKGLCFALGRPLVTVSSLAATALSAGQVGQTVVVAVDARRGDVYGAVYRVVGPGLVTPLEADALFTPSTLAAAAAAHGEIAGFLGAGDAAALIPGLSVTGVTGPSAEAVARLGLEKFRHTNVDELTSAEPAYLRLAAPEEKAASQK